MQTAIIAILLAAALWLCAQIDNGNIMGRVADPMGAGVMGADVTLPRTEMNFETVDDWTVRSKLTVNYGLRYNVEPRGTKAFSAALTRAGVHTGTSNVR